MELNHLTDQLKTLTGKVAALEESRNAITTWLKVAVILAGILGIGGGFLSSTISDLNSRISQLQDQVKQAGNTFREEKEKSIADLKSKIDSLTAETHKAQEDFKKDSEEALSDFKRVREGARREEETATAEFKSKLASLTGDVEKAEEDLKRQRQLAFSEINAAAAQIQTAMNRSLTARSDDIVEKALTELRNRSSNLKTEDAILRNVKVSGSLSVDGNITFKGSPLYVQNCVSTKRMGDLVRIPLSRQILAPAGTTADDWMIFTSLRGFTIPANRVPLTFDAGLTRLSTGKGWTVDPSVRDAAGVITQEGFVDYVLIPRK